MSGRRSWPTNMQAVIAAIWNEVLTPEALQTDVGRELAKDMMTPALKFFQPTPRRRPLGALTGRPSRRPSLRRRLRSPEGRKRRR